MVAKPIKEIKNRKKILVASVIIAIVLISLAGFLLSRKVELPPTTPTVTPTEGAPRGGAPTTTPTEGAVVACPKDYCDPIQCGAGPCPERTGKKGVPCFEKTCCLEDGTQKYFEQTCYDYPEKSANCEAEKKIYYLICGERQET